MIKKDSLILLGFALTLSSIGCSKISNATDVQLSDNSNVTFNQDDFYDMSSSIACSDITDDVVEFLDNGDGASGVSQNDIDDIFEKENSEMVTFPINYFSPAMSSVPGQPIKLKLDNSSFECKIEHGSFEYYNDVKNTTVYSDETIYYCPTYKRDEVFIHEYDTSFVDITVNGKNGIIGYAVVKIIYDESDNNWRPQLLVSNLFVDENNNEINVSDDYLGEKMANYHKNFEGNIFEKENSEMVTFPINYFSPAMSSVPGQPIKLKLDNSSFECKIEHGSFEYYNDVKNTTVYSDETIYYCPTYKRDEVFIHEYDTSFVDIIASDENGIIGYAIVKIIYNETESNWHPQLLVSSLFVNEYNNTINVSNDYLERIMTNYHKNLED